MHTRTRVLGWCSILVAALFALACLALGARADRKIQLMIDQLAARDAAVRAFGEDFDVHP